MGNYENLPTQNSIGYLMLSVLSGVIFIIVLVNCACTDAKNESAENDNNQVTKREKSKSKKSSKKSKRENGGGAVGEEIALEIIESEKARHSAGSNGTGSGAINGNRPKSHLHDGTRALPEIPDGQQLYNSSEERSFHPYAVVPGEQDSTYAAVSGASDIDPDYAGISTADASSETYAQVKDAVQPSDSNSKQSTKNSHSYAEVSNIGEATYAQISEKRESTRRKTVVSTVSTDTIDPYLLPPVPDKLPNILEPDSKRSSSTLGSPTLPPRNSILDSDNIPFADEGSPQHEVHEVHEVHESLVAASGRSPGGKRREPPYDDITARESLSHIRERQAKEEERAAFDREYDEIKSVPSSRASAAVSRIPGDRNSLSSDTYAEIGQNDMSGRRHSSIYSQVREEGDNAPTPPPLESLKQLAHHDAPGNGRLTRHSRPASAFSTGSSLYTTVEDVDNEATSKSHPIYAVPKKGDKRRTVHTSDARDSRDAQAASGGSATLVADHLYSQVDKARKQKPSKDQRHSEYDNIEIMDVNDNNGARPKVMMRDANQNNASSAAAGGGGLVSNDSEQSLRTKRRTTAGYQTIADVDNPDAPYDDPDYDTVEERGTVLLTDSYDVDYESLPGSAAAMATRCNKAAVTTAAEGQSQAPPRISSSDVTDVSVTTGPGSEDANANPSSSSPQLIHISEHEPRPQVFQRREHIYEQISDSSHENIYTADPTRHVVARTKTANTQQQFFTNL